MSPWLKISGFLLFPFVAFMTGIVYLRNKFFDWHWLPKCEPSVPVISVGNVQIGGTGKTPMVEYLVRNMENRGYHPAILTRGYGRKEKGQVVIYNKNRANIVPEQVGDEPFLLSKNLPQTTIIVDSNRCRGAKFLRDNLSENLLILDDGFQHRKIDRNIDIVMVDVLRWSNCPLLFPITCNRDLPGSLKRADVILLTRTDIEPLQTDKVKEHLMRVYRKPVLQVEIALHHLISSGKSRRISLGSLQSEKIFAFCGLGHPAQFFNLLEKSGLSVNRKWEFPDHHNYKVSEIRKIVAEAESKGVKYIVTSQKDHVKLLSMEPVIRNRVWYTEIDLQVKNSELFMNLIEKRIGTVV
ncbi:MAG: tetraacyldisaccharide 4'-kinase [Calditrichaeota bacterium]|nr:tetraacyldisaccharide 4'-kinase [Calditrichota bacterium]RQW05973.1 MAG: tetraacyldisaccharide 4'-kinase [Calditrichota bacterium]